MHIEIWKGNTSWKVDTLRPKRRWKDNINIDTSELGCENGRWMELGKDHVQRQT
jgi:hypothetical protein